MNSKQFFSETVKMRKLQKEYFKTRSSLALRACKNQEKIIDAEIDRVKKLVPKDLQIDLFNH